MLYGGHFSGGSSGGLSFEQTPFLLSPGDINVSLGDQLGAASGPFVKIADFLNDYFLDPMEPVVDILETEFSIAGLQLLGAGKTSQHHRSWPRRNTERVRHKLGQPLQRNQQRR